MRFFIIIYILCLVCSNSIAFGQNENFSGTWETAYDTKDKTSLINIELKIAMPEKGLLYPARLALQYKDFKGEYQLLLVKKSSRELAISKNKFAVEEVPFSLGTRTQYLNGIFDLSKDMKGNPSLSIMRITSKVVLNDWPDSIKSNPEYLLLASQLLKLLKDASVSLKKVNSDPWMSPDAEKLLQPTLSPAYFGLMDTIVVPVKQGNLKITGSKKKEYDIISLALNGNSFINLHGLDRKKYEDHLILDTGLNILCFYAENFGNNEPNKGELEVEFNNQKFKLDFKNKIDSAATFIVARLYCAPDRSKDIYFQSHGSGGNNFLLKRDEKLVGDIISTSAELTFAVWDDAVEDGDSISINIDGKWIVQGFPVKKHPQFITVTLKPGQNTITFLADNLGSIPPNTSVLEIIDGAKRKSYHIETSVGEKNLVRIYYDVKARPR